jgi:hypothetical protein
MRPFRVDIGGVVGGTLAGIAVVVAVVLSVCYWRKRKTPPARLSPLVAYPTTPFMSEASSPPPQTRGPTYGQKFFTGQADVDPAIPPLTRSAILREALAAGNHAAEPLPSSQSIMSGTSSGPLQPLRRQPSIGFNTDQPGSASYTGAFSPSVDASVMSGYNFTADQLELIEQLRADNVPSETIARVAEGFLSRHDSSADTSSIGRGFTRGGSIFSAAPPSYQTRYGS